MCSSTCQKSLTETVQWYLKIEFDFVFNRREWMWMFSVFLTIALYDFAVFQ